MRISKPTTRKFYFVDDPDKASITIRSLLPGERTDIRDQVFTQEIEYRPGDSGIPLPVLRQTSDNKADREKTFNARIVDWENVFDESGKPLEFNEENLIRAMREIPGFVEAVNIFFKKLDDDLAEERKGQEKN